VSRPPVLRKLQDPAPVAGATARGRGPVAHCRLGFRHPVQADRSAAAPLPPAGAVLASEREIALWRSRIGTGPFVSAGDYREGSPGDWERIQRSARTFMLHGEPAWSERMPHEARGAHGSRMRDAAFFHLLTGEPRALGAVRAQLLREAANPLNDFAATLCITLPDGVTLDAHFMEASWLLRYLAAYDFVRRHLPAADRMAIEAFIARNARFFAAHLDFGSTLLFPRRESGDYRVRGADAAPGADAARTWMRRFDTNGDCETDDKDLPGPWPAHAYVEGSGRLGPRMSTLSQWYNNRKSMVAAAIGAAGILLDDNTLVASAARYFLEWLTYSVWPDGSQGEFARHDEYCIAQQGVVYASANIQGATLLATALARQGDMSLIEFSTREGLFGSASQPSDSPKSLGLAIRTYVRLIQGELDWHLHEAWKAKPEPRRATRLGGNVVRFMGGGEIENYHELGMLPATAWIQDTGLEDLVLRTRSASRLRFPGASGGTVATGYGQWSDALNVMPAVLLLRP
jgi:hypothetical protein